MINFGKVFSKELEKRKNKVYKAVLEVEKQFAPEFKKMYREEIKSGLKTTILDRAVSTRIYNQNKEKPAQLNIYHKLPKIINSHLNGVTSRSKNRKQLIFYDYVRKSTRRKELMNFVNTCFENKHAFTKGQTLFIIYNEKTKKVLSKFLRKSYHRMVKNDDKKGKMKEVKKHIKDFLSVNESSYGIAIPIATITSVTKRRKRLNLQKVKNKIENKFKSEVSKRLKE